MGVSIHAPRVGCDHHIRVSPGRFVMFQFTHPAWGATHVPFRDRLHSPHVSIHAPRVGCDVTKIVVQSGNSSCFNSRTPRGVRPRVPHHQVRSVQVSIHAPRVGCDLITPHGGSRRKVSIHAPRVGCDIRTTKSGTPGIVSIHAPRVGCDQRRCDHRQKK